LVIGARALGSIFVAYFFLAVIQHKYRAWPIENRKKTSPKPTLDEFVVDISIKEAMKVNDGLVHKTLLITKTGLQRTIHCHRHEEIAPTTAAAPSWGYQRSI
jgi:hypothetical protein